MDRHHDQWAADSDGAVGLNAVQLATGPVLAVAGNSPTFLGHTLWEETRVALFKQSIDDRDAAGRASRRVCRTAFGTGWVHDGAFELFEQSVRLHEPIMPALAAERPLDRTHTAAARR